MRKRNGPSVDERTAALKPAALDRAKQLLEAGDTDELLLAAAKGLLTISQKFIDRVGGQVLFRGFDRELVLRCITARAGESLDAIISLVESGRGYFGLALLRPMCEDLIFARFIKALDEQQAEQFLQHSARLELAEGIRAQERFFESQRRKFGRPKRREQGSPTEIHRLDARIDEEKRALKLMAKSLGWGNRISPTVKAMALATGSLDEYTFFYRAASGAVHSNTHHLGRMVWGDPSAGKFSISNRNFDTFYRRFGLVHGGWLASLVMEVVREDFSAEWPDEDDDDYSVWLALIVVPAIEHGFPSIVTQEELRWPKGMEPHDPAI